MLIQQIFTGPDFEKSLRQRRLAALALLAVGLVGIACYLLLVPGSTLPDFARGFYLGAAGGICLGAIILLCRTQYLLTHPQAMKRARVRETDERERAIINAAFQWAGCIMFFGSAAALFVILPLSMEAFAALLGMMALYALSFVVLTGVLKRQM